MKTSEAIDQLAKALAAAQGEIKNATLNKVNPHFKSKYADLAAIRDAVVPSLAKHGIAVTQGTGSDGSGLAMLLFTRLLHQSGQWIECAYPMTADVSMPQKMGSALTYARRYSLAAICGIAAEEDDDANAAQTNTGNGSKPTYPKSNSRPIFARLDQDQLKITELDKLSEWRGKTTAEREKLDGDFKIDLDFNYVAHGMSIAESTAALSAFYKDAYKNIMPGMPLDKQEDLTAMKDFAKSQLAKIETLAAG
jgi:hypothetical protein